MTTSHVNTRFKEEQITSLVLGDRLRGPHLVQSGLGNGVVLHAEPLLMAGEEAENVGQSSLGGRELILQCVVMLLLEDAARERLLDEVLD